MPNSTRPGGAEALAWTPTTRDEPHDYRVFEVRRQRALHPRTREERTFSVIHSPDWVNVIALTPDDQVVLIEQWRHGTEAVTLEIPGGMVDRGESSLEAARRELREETGYAAQDWVYLGVVEPNPAIQTNRCETWLALDAAEAHPVDLDPGEVIAVDTRPLADVGDLIGGARITHALVVAAFAHLMLEASGLRRPSSERLRELTEPSTEHART